MPTTLPFSENAFRNAVNAGHSLSDIALGNTAMKKFTPHISTTAQGDRIFDHLVSEAAAAARAIDKKFMSVSFLAGAGPIPGNPVGTLQAAGGAGVGYYQLYQNGAIYWRRDLGAFWVHGSIYQKYLALKAENGLLGFPVSDELTAMDKSGRFSNFEKGSIYWHPLTNAFEIHGQIRSKWLQLGGTNFGYPVSDEWQLMGGGLAFNDFRDVVHGGTDASIYWAPDTGAHEVRGAIRQRWLQLGGYQSYLGYPVGGTEGWTDPMNNNTGFINRFQYGSIAWTADDQKTTEFPQTVSFRSEDIGVSSLGGWAEVIIASSGYFQYRGHLHNSGAIGFNVKVASGIPIPGTEIVIVTKTEEMNIGGTSSIDDRNEDWDSTGYSADVRGHWENIRGAHIMSTHIVAGPGPLEVLLSIFLVFFAAIVILELVVGGKPSDTHCETSGMHTVTDGNNHTIAEPSAVRCGLPGPPK